MNFGKLSILISLIVSLCFLPAIAYADSSENLDENSSTEQEFAEVEKVIVHFWMMGSQGQWVPAQGDWTAVKNGTKALSVYNNPARKNSPLCVGNVTYTFNEQWIDDFGNIYAADNSIRLKGSDFIAMFNGYQGPTIELNVYAQYIAEQDYYFHGIWTDNVANGGGNEDHIVNRITGYTHTFATPPDIPSKYSFLYWDGGDYGQAVEGSKFEIPAGSLNEDLTVEFIATYEYTPTSLVQVIYKTSEGIVYQTEPSAEPINIKENAPLLENGQWLFETCSCVGETAKPEKVDPIITTVKIPDEPIVTTYTVYGVFNGTNGKDGSNGQNGADGKDGTNGVDGKDGIDGIDGKDGVDGQQGVTGEKGEKGDSGKDGLNGKKGDKGSIGKRGLRGKTGARGPRGSQGIPGYSYSYKEINPIIGSSSNQNSSVILDDTNPLSSGKGTVPQTGDEHHWLIPLLFACLAGIITVIAGTILSFKNKKSN